VEQYLELPVLGTIPYAEINQETRKRKSKKKKSKSQT
jgi:hypothetical protein